MVKVLIAGDFCDSNRISKCIFNKSFEGLFGAIKPIIEKTDYSIVNFEFPIAFDSANPIKKCGPNLKGQVVSVDAIKYADFRCCTLANNHILDQGEDCALKTRDLIHEYGIDTVGFGENLTKASAVLYKEINGEILAIINCCEHEFSIASYNSAGANPLDPIRQYYQIIEAKGKADYVLVITHGGSEYYQLPTSRMKELYRFFIEIGADAVVNHHQHCYSGYEIWKGKPIFYGIGNFLFDWKGKKSNSWNEGFVTMIDFKKDKIDYSLIPYYQCKEEPKLELMTGNYIESFRKKIAELNKIILDDELLIQENEYYFSRCVNNEILTLNPYNNKILKKLFLLGYLPNLIKRNSIHILNHIECESYRDILVYTLKKMSK